MYAWTQEEQLGLGHAMLCAGPHMTGEPLLLMLGDHLYRSTHEQQTSCVQQLLSAYDGSSVTALRQRAVLARPSLATWPSWGGPRWPPSARLAAYEGLGLPSALGRKRPSPQIPRNCRGPRARPAPSSPMSRCIRRRLQVMALRKTPEEHVSHYGTVTGKWEPKRGKAAKEFLTLTAICEKPTAEYAASNLTIPGYAEGDYLTAFGLYIVTEPKLFDILKEIKKHTAANHTVQFTPALDQLRQEYGLVGHVLQGERYDIGGTPSTYLDTLNMLAGHATTLADVGGEPIGGAKRQKL